VCDDAVVRAGVVAALFLICACATTTSAVAPDEKLDPRFAYLYGRFHIKADEQPGSFGGRQSIGLKVRCGDLREYMIWFTAKPDVQVLKVYPARCALVSAHFTDGAILQWQENVEAADMLIHEFVAGRAYYLGDYFARGIHKQHFYWRSQSWAMDPAGDRYEGTTAEMKRTFAQLAGWPTADKRLITPKPVSKPGVVVIADAKEPVMTPERIARVAPFVGRTFATPAACEAACPTGQCLPFRGEAGPAMTCIVRCNGDKDCPEGLACNCPDSGKPGPASCHTIATTPADTMARICLSVEPATPAAP
jgi:hypothetical protein